MLIIYPSISLVFGASHLASTILQDASQGMSGTQALTTKIAAVATQTVPLIATPFIMVGCLGALGKVGAFASGVAMGAMAKKAKGTQAAAKEGWDNSAVKRGGLGFRSKVATGIGNKLSKKEGRFAGLAHKMADSRTLAKHANASHLHSAQLDKAAMENASQVVGAMDYGTKQDIMLGNRHADPYVTRAVLAETLPMASAANTRLAYKVHAKSKDRRVREALTQNSKDTFGWGLKGSISSGKFAAKDNALTDQAIDEAIAKNLGNMSSKDLAGMTDEKLLDMEAACARVDESLNPGDSQTITFKDSKGNTVTRLVGKGENSKRLHRLAKNTTMDPNAMHQASKTTRDTLNEIANRSGLSATTPPPPGIPGGPGTPGSSGGSSKPSGPSSPSSGSSSPSSPATPPPPTTPSTPPSSGGSTPPPPPGWTERPSGLVVPSGSDSSTTPPPPTTPSTPSSSSSGTPPPGWEARPSGLFVPKDD